MTAGFRARLGRRGDKRLSIPVILEDRFPPVAAIRHMVNRAGYSMRGFRTMRAGLPKQESV
jgi:hypothetical protein